MRAACTQVSDKRQAKLIDSLTGYLSSFNSLGVWCRVHFFDIQLACLHINT